MQHSNDILIVNRFTNNVTKKVFTMAHLFDTTNMVILKSYPKMESDSLEFFTAYKYIMICDVTHSSMLSEINIIKQ